jgi:hypothetical protein
MEMGLLDLEKFKWLHPAHVESSGVDYAGGNQEMYFVPVRCSYKPIP